MTRRWCLVHVKTRREHEAERHLLRQGFEVFLPKTWKTIRHARRSTVEKRAYFPGYLFVDLDLDQDQWRPINSTVGVLRMVTIDHAPAAAPPGLVETLMSAINDEGVVAITPEWRVGERVRIVGGAFTDQIATIDALPDADRVRVLLELMQTPIPVELRRDQISKDA